MKAYSIFGPPGTGKTTELVRRIKLIHNKNKHDKILVVSFTKAAAKEISDRADGLASFSTIHSLCYRMCGVSKSQVVSKSHLKELTRFIGVDFSGSGAYDEEQTIGDMMLSIRSLSVNRLDPNYEYTYQTSTDQPGTLSQYMMVCKAYDKWKSEFGYIDFNDMLLRYDGSPLEYDHLFIDEAQDLSNLQWKLIDTMISVSNLKTVTVAGDDDQCIYAWSGASYEGMRNFEMKHDAQRTILDKSYRLPKKIWEIANNQIRFVKDRIDKKYNPVSDGGIVTMHSSVNTVPVEANVDTLYLYRCHSMRNDIESNLLSKAVPYSVIGSSKPSPWDSSYATAIDIFERGKESFNKFGKDMLNDTELKILTKRLDKTAKYMTEVKGIGYIFKFRWWDVIDMPSNIVTYFRQTLYNGYKLDYIPKIRLSTIHGSKGMEADRVVLINDVTENMVKHYARNPDDERRVFYVGMTRARKELRIVDGHNPVLFLKGISFG